MPWDRVDNPWIKKQRRFVWSLGLGTSGFALLILTASAWIIWRSNTISSAIPGALGRTVRLSLLIPVAFQFAIVIWSIRFAIREWRIYRLVPRHDAMICPRCHRVMQSDDQGVVRCPKGHSTWPRDHLVHYWEQYGLARKSSWRMLSQMRRVHEHRRFDLVGRYQDWVWRKPVTATICAPFVMIVVLAVATLLMPSGSLLSVARFAPFLFLGGVGAMCMGFGVKQRRGNEMYCARCEYEREASQTASASRCPECGSSWNEPGGTIRGKLTSKSMLAITGFVLMFGAFVLYGSQSSGFLSAWSSRLAPTSALVSSLGRSPHASDADWVELLGRDLTADQRDRLAELLLDQRRRVSYFSATDGSTWLDNAVHDQLISDTLITRFFDESLDLWIAGPHRAKVDEPVTITIEGSNHLRAQSWWEVTVAVGGFELDGQPLMHSREEKWRSDISLDSDLREHMPKLAGREHAAPTLSHAFAQPGTQSVLFRAWIVVRPTNAPTHTNVWLEDGSPALPDDAVYVKEVKLTHTINVSPN